MSSYVRFTGLSVEETAKKKLEESECWDVKSSWKNEDFEGNKKGNGPRPLNKAPKIVLKKARYKIRNWRMKLSQQLASQV